VSGLWAAERFARRTGVAAAGDLVLCIKCQVFQVVTEDGGVRLLTNREWLVVT
jgi:hypothetical protein